MERSAPSARGGTLYALLCDRLAVLEPCAVAAVTRVFLDVSLMPCEERLWSLEFAFDQDDGRIARVVACFVDRNAKGVRRDGLVVTA